MEERIRFINRDGERGVLRKTLTSARSELVILYGRRGVGKSALLEHATEASDGPVLFYRATRRTLPLQMESLTEAAREAFPGAFLVEPFRSFPAFLEFVSYQAQRHSDPVTVVLDEIPYLADVDPGALTTIQHWWDANKRRPNLKVFLAGSYLAFMERQVLDAAAPLYNRRTGAMRLEPMDYAEAALFFPQYSPEERVVAYAILGGMPSYLEQFGPDRTIEENVKGLVLQRNTYLAEEPDWLLLEDLRRDVMYGSILRAIAMRNRKPSDIAQAVGKKSAQDISPHLATLQGLGMVTREVPVTDRDKSRSRNSLYFVSDNYLAFWYRYVDPFRSLVARGLGHRIWERAIAPSLHEFISYPIFENVCRQYLWRALAQARLPEELAFTDIGAWWGGGDIEIDVIALNEHRRVVLAGSCKWTNEPMDVSDYHHLQNDLARSGLEAQSPFLALFSRSGFTGRLRSLAAAQEPTRLLLVSLSDLFAGS